MMDDPLVAKKPPAISTLVNVILLTKLYIGTCSGSQAHCILCFLLYIKPDITKKKKGATAVNLSYLWTYLDP